MNAIFREAFALYDAKLKKQTQDPWTEIHVETIDLSTARDRKNPFEVNFPFKAFRVRSATDSNANVNFIPNNKDARQGDGSEMKKNAVFNSEDPISKALFWWSAQAGKTIVIEFYRNSHVVPGLVDTSVSMRFASVNTGTKVTVGVTATVIVAQDLDAQETHVFNHHASETIYVGDSSVTLPSGTKPGTPVAPGQGYIHKATGVLYGIAAVANDKIGYNTYR